MIAPRSIRTVFMGSDPIALPMLQSLEERIPAIRLTAVFTQPDRPKGRGQKLQANAIKQWAQGRAVEVLQPERCGPPEVSWVRDRGIALVLVMAYGQLLKPDFLAAPSLGIYNLHTSLLPRYRGASPIHTALAEGEKVTGVSLMRLVPAMDAGPVLDQERVEIGSTTTAPELIAALASACVPLVARGLPPILAGTARAVEQDPAAVTYCRRLFKEDAPLDFMAPAAVLDRRIRAFQPWPGAGFEFAGTVLRIGSARPVQGQPGQPGTLLRPAAGRLQIRCGEGSLEILSLQRPGGRLLPTAEFLRGCELPAGAVATSRTMAPLVGKRPFPWKWRPGDPVDGIVG